VLPQFLQQPIPDDGTFQSGRRISWSVGEDSLTPTVYDGRKAPENQSTENFCSKGLVHSGIS
jgi:hypothetical protein